jgi:hypothetical protein
MSDGSDLKDILTFTLRGTPELEAALWNAAAAWVLDPAVLVERLVAEGLQRTGYLKRGRREGRVTVGRRAS